MFAIRTITAIVTAAVLFANAANAANVIPRAAEIATNPSTNDLLRPIPPTDTFIYHLVAACGPPNNGGHHAGSSCKFFSGPSDQSAVISGRMLHLYSLRGPVFTRSF